MTATLEPREDYTLAEDGFWADWLPPFEPERDRLLGWWAGYVRPLGGEAYRLVGFDG